MLFTVIEENVDVVELCVNVSSPVIDCPIDFPFEVRLSTLGQTASKPHPQKCHNFNSTPFKLSDQVFCWYYVYD